MWLVVGNLKITLTFKLKPKRIETTFVMLLKCNKCNSFVLFVAVKISHVYRCSSTLNHWLSDSTISTSHFYVQSFGFYLVKIKWFVLLMGLWQFWKRRHLSGSGSMRREAVGFAGSWKVWLLSYLRYVTLCRMTNYCPSVLDTSVLVGSSDQ